MTTLGIVDLSDFNATAPPASGLVMATHKATEGTGVHHKQIGARLNAYREAGVPILGSYHVLRTPGSGGAGSLAAQLAYWVAYLDSTVPWWRTWPHWVMQIDAEHWPYDIVSASTVKAFAALLVRSGLPGWKITYASRGQYGDSLKGIATPLWNASYGQNTGTYPGDAWSTGWAPYSGQTPVLLQYTSKPYDRNAYRGTLAQLLALTGTGDDDMALRDDPDGKYLYPRVQAIAHLDAPADGPEKGAKLELVTAINEIRTNAAKAAEAADTPVAQVTITQEQLNAAVAANIPALAAAIAQHIKVS